MNQQEEIKNLQNRLDKLQSLFETSLKDANSKIESLKIQIYKNQFSNLYIFDEEVKFRNILIFPKLDTPIATSTTDSTGKIAIKDDTGTTRYIPYF